MSNNLSQASGKEWTKFPVKSLPNGISYTRTVLFGQYLVVLTHERRPNQHPASDSRQAILLAIDLQDKSVQEAQIDKDMFCYHDEYTLTKYGDNQIIKFGGSHHNTIIGSMSRITISSFKRIFFLHDHVDLNFQAFLIEYEEIQDCDSFPKIRLHTAQIYRDCLYIFGGRNDQHLTGPENTTWRFNLRSREWTEYKRNEEKPDDENRLHKAEELSDGIKLDRPRDRPSSFVVGNKLYIYGGDSMKDRSYSDLKDIFVLELDTMDWKKLEQLESYLEKDVFPDGTQLNGDMYRDNLILLGGDKYFDHTIFCWSHRSNSWSSSKIKNHELTEKSNLIVSDNLLLMLGQDEKGLSLATLNLDDINLPASKPNDEECRCSLFMKKEKSDWTIKLGHEKIPVHKDILKEGSEFFKNLLESDMSESRAEEFKVQDFDEIIFREFLRFIYCGKVDFNEDHELALGLLKLAHMYTEENLESLCMKYFTYQMSSSNFFIILDYARENKLFELQELCLKNFGDLLNLTNFCSLIQSIPQETSPEFTQGNLDLRNKAFDFILKTFRYIDPQREDEIQYSENFLGQNITMENIKKLVWFLDIFAHDDVDFYSLPDGSFESLTKPKPNSERVKSKFELYTANLRDATYDFLRKNFEETQIVSIIRGCSSEFNLNLFLFMSKKLRDSECKVAALKKNHTEVNEEENGLTIEEDKNLVENQLLRETQRTHKRKEPGKQGVPEENPELKKTKKD